MAWKVVNVYKQRKSFILMFLEDKYSMAELCRQFEITRRVGYKWVNRFKQEGFEGLEDRSCAPLKQFQETSLEIVNEILEVKAKYPTWGPKKIRGYLVNKQPFVLWPSTTTTGNILEKHGLTKHRKIRKRFPAKTSPLSGINYSNDVWSVDFKGWVLSNHGYKCDPLTITDNFSRFLLRCVKLGANDTNYVWAIFDSLFREYGLPNYIRSDNGPPFATSGAGRLSPLSIRLIKAGVIPEWIDPGEPQQNGRHERMHGTLQQEGIFSNLTLEEQQKSFKLFQDYFNFERPHEALGNKTPGNVYTPSQRSWNGQLKAPEYGDDYKKGWIKSCGKMSWKGQEIYIGRTLAEEYVGLKENAEGSFTIYYGPIIIGALTKENEFNIPRREGRKKRNKT
jgi:putative transposase